jgi:hypothetical protein
VLHRQERKAGVALSHPLLAVYSKENASVSWLIRHFVQVASIEIAIVQFLDGYAVTKIIPGKLFTSSWIKKEQLARIIRLLEALQDGVTALFRLFALGQLRFCQNCM